MKQLSKKFAFRASLTILMFTLFETLALAQDSTNYTAVQHVPWYRHQGVWVAGLIILVLLISAWLRFGKMKGPFVKRSSPTDPSL